MNQVFFSMRDQLQLKRHGLSVLTAAEQIRRFKKGFRFVNLTAACTLKNGIRKLSPKEERSAEKNFLRKAPAKKTVKFVPASGAASRMFHFLEDDAPAASKNKDLFFKSISKFAFYPELAAVLKKKILTKDRGLILKALLDSSGLGYRKAPKGMIRFHFDGKKAKTAFEEQLDEGRIFADAKKRVFVHFTLPMTARKEVREHLKKTARQFHQLRWEISDSVQSPATDCLAAEKSGRPARDENGKLLLRPAGHGALLKNLNRIRADLIYVKNIDNILPASRRKEADRWKKIVSGVFMEEQTRLFSAQKILAQKTMKPTEALYVLRLAREWGWQGGGRKELKRFFDRPLRVCGMVPNTGEPGGGPFWVKDHRGFVSAQIIEKAEVDLKNKKQEKIWQASTHFNPVDFVCGVYNWRGKKYDLEKFTDPERGLISKKNHAGREIQAMELPGLWNGGMANWISLFVEIPARVFAPVKTVLDLLRTEHRGLSPAPKAASSGSSKNKKSKKHEHRFQY